VIRNRLGWLTVPDLMLGRVAELERLADVLNFSKARMQDKVGEFQEKHEFSRIHSVPAPKPSDNFRPRSGYSSYSHTFDHSLAEFSELEMDRYDDFNILSRSLTEISADITEVLTQLDGFVRRVDGDIDEFTKLAHRLQDEITQARMVPIGNLYTRLSRTVRDAAKAVNKKVELTLAGAETELDNNIIQQISDPLIHLVRNAVAHGLERDEERYEQGKSDTGNVAVRAYHRGNHIYIEVEDDGRGIDYEKVRKTAVDHGLVSSESAADLGERELLDLLFQPGFSTAPRKTELAGRGVGLDVVDRAMAMAGGEVRVATEPGAGTTFEMILPPTLALLNCVIVRSADQVYCIESARIADRGVLDAPQIEKARGASMIAWRGEKLPLVRLQTLLGQPLSATRTNGGSIIVAQTSDPRHTSRGRTNRIAVVVDTIEGEHETLVRSLGQHAARWRGVSGATESLDGSVALVLDLEQLLETKSDQDAM